MAATSSLRHLWATASKENEGESDAESSAEMLEIGDFRIDTRGHRATLRGEPLELTGEEFDVLLFLTTNPQSTERGYAANNVGYSLDSSQNPADPIP